MNDFEALASTVASSMVGVCISVGPMQYIATNPSRVPLRAPMIKRKSNRAANDAYLDLNTGIVSTGKCSAEVARLLHI